MVMMNKKLFSLCLFSCRCLCSGSLCCRSFSLRSSLAATTSLLSAALASLGHVLIEVNELDESNGSSIATTCAELDYASVTTRTVSNLCCNSTEELLDGLFVLKVAKNYTA